jgi:hypothetical protein
MDTSPAHFTQLSDQQLLETVKRLADDERHATTALIRSLMELDARRLYLGEGYPSLFAYCTQVLRLSEHAAYNRIEVARAGRRHPRLLDALEAGDITLTAARLLAAHLTSQNCERVLAAARHRNKRQIEALVSSLRPMPDAPALIRKMPTAAAQTLPQPGTLTGGAPESSQPARTQSVLSAASSRASSIRTPPKPAVQSVAPERYRIQFTATQSTHDKLRRAQDLLRHVVPNGDPAEIFDRALTLLVKDLERTRLASVGNARAAREPAPGSRHIPADVKRTVWRRDQGRCAFIGARGRCPETGFLEWHHVQPFAAGGRATVENIELRCRSHNQHEARLFFGEELTPGADDATGLA